jgi:hypothetical protein
MNTESIQEIDTIIELTTDELKPSLGSRWADSILERGDPRGTKYSFDQMEKAFAARRESWKFVRCVLDADKILMAKGKKLTQREQKGNGYCLMTTDHSESTCINYPSKARELLVRSIVFSKGLLNDATAELSDQSKRRLASLTEKNAVRIALFCRTKAIMNAVEKQDHKSLLVTGS